MAGADNDNLLDVVSMRLFKTILGLLGSIKLWVVEMTMSVDKIVGHGDIITGLREKAKGPEVKGLLTILVAIGGDGRGDWQAKRRQEQKLRG